MRWMIAATLLSTALAIPAAAQHAPDAGAWKLDGQRAVVVSAGISLPARASGLSLTKTGESSQNGSGLDDVAQYESEDGVVFATVFIFYATYADTALASLATDMAIRQRFGPAVMVDSETLVAAAGVPRVAIRRIYEKGELKPGAPLTSAAAFVRAGGWQVAVRVSGPAPRRSEIEAALDALLADMRFSGKAKPMEAAPVKMSAPCPASDNRAAKRAKKGKDSNADMLVAALLGGAIELNSEEDKPDKQAIIAFPGNGASAICVRAQVTTARGVVDILQPANPEADSMRLIALTDDAGGLMAIEPQLISDGYQVKRYGIGFVDVLGGFQTLPNAVQIGAILDGSDREGAKVRSRTSFTPDGKSNITINSDTFK